MKLTVLGSGTVVPDGRRSSSGYFVEAGDVRMMMDCGAGSVHALPRYGCAWEKMTHLYISHFHVDHVAELPALFFAFKHGMRSERREPLTIIGPSGLERVMEGFKQALGERLFIPRFPVGLTLLAPGDQIELSEDATLGVAKTPHNEESLAVRVTHRGRSICYTGDTDYSEDIAHFFAKTSVMVSECSFLERREGVPHVTAADVGRMAALAEAERLIVTHFYFDVDEDEVTSQIRRYYSGEVIVGTDGLKIAV